MPQAPETYEELEKIFNSCRIFDIPLDLVRYAEIAIPDMILRLGNSLTRLKKLKESKTSEDAIKYEESLSRKYHQVLVLRRSEFILFVQQVSAYQGFSDQEILENMNLICITIREYIQRNKRT